MGWNTIEDMFAALHNAKEEYIILRNYEEMDADNFYTSGHADIDFLARNGEYFAKCIHAYPRFASDDGVHYKVLIADTEVIIDVRSVGDGYYDANWERALLRNRVLLDGRFYIADKENSYYSLVYHAILQKKELAEDYLLRLNKMAENLGIQAKTEQEHLMELACYMKEKGYYYTIPYDIWVPLRQELIDIKMVKRQLNVRIRDIYTGLLQFGSKVKNSFFHR